MVRQINPSLSRLWLNENSRQYGANQRLVLNHLTEPELRVLDYLELGVTESQFPQLSKLTKTKPEKLASLLEKLSPLIVRTSAFMPEISGLDVERSFSEIMRLYLLEHQDPVMALQKRKSSKVYISHLDRTGVMIMKALSASGLGTLFTADQSKVSKSDTLELGFPEHALGKQRAVAAKQLLSNSRIELHSRVTQSFDRAECAVIIANAVVAPADYARWLSRDVPHLSITYDEVGVQVSHLVLPGITPCLGCLEIERMQQDASWARIAPQLANLDRNLGDSSVSLFAAGVGVSLVLNLIDDVESLGSQKITRLSRDSSVYQRELPTTNCGCRLGE